MPTSGSKRLSLGEDSNVPKKSGFLSWKVLDQIGPNQMFWRSSRLNIVAVGYFEKIPLSMFQFHFLVEYFNGIEK